MSKSIKIEFFRNIYKQELVILLSMMGIIDCINKTIFFFSSEYQSYYQHGYNNQLLSLRLLETLGTSIPEEIIERKIIEKRLDRIPKPEGFITKSAYDNGIVAAIKTLYRNNII